jgi:hypothetical protein
MANDLSNPVNATVSAKQSGDGFFDHGSGSDSLFGGVQLAQAEGGATPPAPGQTIHVNPPQDAAGPVVIRVEVAPGSIVELPQPFDADAALAAKEGDGNLAIRVGDVTVILQGYIQADNDPQHPVTIEGADGKPIDIATILASTDPAIDIQTAAGPGDTQGGQGADNTGAILAQLDGGNGLGGLTAVGGQDQTELGYSLIDGSLRQEFAQTFATPGVFGFSVGQSLGLAHESSLRDPAQVDSLGSFDTFMHEYQDAVEHPGSAMFAGWADFQGTGVSGESFQDYLDQTSKTVTVDANFTGATGDLVLTGIADGVTSNGSHLSVEFADGGHTMFIRRDEATATDTGNALVAVVHVDGPDANGEFTIQTILINRLDHGPGDNGKDEISLEVQFKVYDGPAPNPETQEGDQAPQSPSIEGSFSASFADDVPILESVKYHNQHEMIERREAEGSTGSDVGLVDEDWLDDGSNDKDTGTSGDTGGGTCVTGCIQVNFGADGAALSDGATEKTLPGKHAFVLDTATYHLGQEFPYGTTGLSSGGQPLKVLSVGPDHLTVGIEDTKQQLLALVEGDETPSEPTDPIPGRAIFTLTLNQDTGQFEFDLKGPLDHGTPSDAIFGDDTGLNALTVEAHATGTEETIPLAFGVTATDDDGDSVHAEIDIDVNDDVPIARNDHDHVEKGSFGTIYGDVMSAWGEDSDAGMDSPGGDGAVVLGVAAGELAGDQTTGAGTVIQGTYGKLFLGLDGGKYSYTRDAGTAGGGDDHFTYTLKDGDGDTSTAVLTVHINNACVTIALPDCPADTTVHESGLAERNGEPAGTDAAANSETTSGHITINAPDTIATLQIGSTTLTLADLNALTPGTPVTIQDGTRGELVLTHFDAGNGHLDYTYNLLDNDLASGDSTTASFDIAVKDLDGSEGDATLKIKIVDDAPIANCDEISAVAGKNADIQFIVDVSGSMKDTSFNVPGSTYPDNGIGLERYAMAQMLSAHPEVQNVQFVLFSDHSSHSVWMTVAQALTYLQDNSNFPGGGNTDYDKALTEAMGALGSARPLPQGDQTLVYFFSDGNPNEPHHDAGIDDDGSGSNVSKAEWEAFVDKHDITNVFTVGIGNISSGELAELTPISYPNIDTPPANHEDNFINITSSNVSVLTQTLDNLVSSPTPGSITDDVTTNDVSGADDFGTGKLVSVSYAGTPHSFDSTTHQFTIGLGTGRGTLVINDDGTYTYTPPAGKADGTPFYVEYTIQDGDGDTSTAKLKIDLKVAPEVDLDANCDGNNATASFIEDQPTPTLIAPAGTISDDGMIGSMTVTLTNRPDGDATERLNVSGLPAGLSSTYVNGVLTITGVASAADYQSVLRSIVYQNGSQNPNETPRTVTVVVKDTESTPLSSITHIVTVSVESVNDAPTATALASGLNVDEHANLSIAGKGLSIADVDAGSDTMTVKLVVGEGALTVIKGSANVNISGSGNGTVTITGSQSEINKVLTGATGSMTYKDDTDTPSASTKLTMTVNDNGNNGDGGSLSTSVQTTITINDLNNKPETDLNGNKSGSDNSASFTEDNGAILISPSGTVKDDSGTVVSMKVTLTSTPDAGAESLSINLALLPAGVTANYAGGVLTITGSASTAAYQTILQHIVYNNTSQAPNGSDRTATVVVNDGSLNSTSHSVTIEVNPVNDAPTATMLSTTPTVEALTDLSLAGKGLSIADVDAGSDTMTVTLKVGEGALTVTKGSAGVSISGSGNDTVTITGSQSEINKVLTGVTGSIVYKDNDSTPSSSTQLTLKVNDNGNNGDGGSLSTTVISTINITLPNQKPETDLNGSSKSGSDNSASFTEDNGAIAISPSGTVKDDSGTVASMTVKLTSTPDGGAESLSVSSAYLPAGVTASYVAGTLTISGPASTATYQTILQHIVYNNTSQAPSDADRTVTVVVNDGSLNSTSHSVTIEVNPVNDAPTATALVSGLNVDEHANLSIAGKGLSIADVDAGSDTMTVKLVVGEGELTVIKGSANVNISGSGNGTVTITGSQSEINKVLTGATGSMTYQDDTDTPSASTKLTMTVNDNGNNGAGGSLSTSVQTIITINNTPEAPIACDDNVITNAGANTFSIPDWALTYNDSDADTPNSGLSLPSGDSAVLNSSGGTAHHSADVTFTDSGGNGGSFDYKVTDGSLTGTGHVSVTQDTNGTLTGSSNDDIVVVYGSAGKTVNADGGDDIVIGGGGNDTLDGGSGNDLVFGQGGDDTMIFGSSDKYDGGTGFDRVQVTGSGGTTVNYTGGSLLNVEMVDLGDTNDRQGQSHQNTLALNAGDITTAHDYGTIGNFKISLFVIGDTNGNSGNSSTMANNRDNVDLTGFHQESGAGSSGSFTDAATGAAHAFNVWTSNANAAIHVAVEQNLDVV